MRAFLGISIPDDLKEKIATIQKKLSKFDIKLVELENLHFNMKFFAEINETQIKDLRKNLEEVCKSSFDIEIAGIGAFPNASYTRVVWFGVREGKESMISLSKTIDEAAEAVGFPKESNFVPHLTLGRVRSIRDRNEMAKTIESLKDLKIGKMKVSKIKLFQSKLGSCGPVYEQVFSLDMS